MPPSQYACVRMRVYVHVRACVRVRAREGNRTATQDRTATPPLRVPLGSQPFPARIPPFKAISGSGIPVSREGNFQNRSEGL